VQDLLKEDLLKEDLLKDSGGWSVFPVRVNQANNEPAPAESLPFSDLAPQRPSPAANCAYDSPDGLREIFLRRPCNDVICYDPRRSERRQHRFQSHHVPTK